MRLVREVANRIATEYRQRRVVEISLHQGALRDEQLLDRPQEPNLVCVVAMCCDVLLEGALHYLRVVRNRIECEDVAQKAEEAALAATLQSRHL